jgi:hypothetical protein
MKAGAKHGLCVNHVPGNVTLENECKADISVNPPPDVHLLFSSAWGQANVSILWWIAVTAAACRRPVAHGIRQLDLCDRRRSGRRARAGVPTSLVKVVLCRSQ